MGLFSIMENKKVILCIFLNTVSKMIAEHYLNSQLTFLIAFSTKKLYVHLFSC